MELALVERIKAGDPAAFDVVFEAYHAKLFSFLARLARDRARAEDLLEEVWLRLVTHGDRLRPDTRLGPWLFTVARHLHVSHCRSRMLEDVYLVDGISLWPSAPPSSPFDETATNELERRVEAALATLPAGYREALLLVWTGELDQADAAGVCGLTPAAFRQRLKRARDLLARRLEESARPLRAFREVTS